MQNVIFRTRRWNMMAGAGFFTTKFLILASGFLFISILFLPDRSAAQELIMGPATGTMDSKAIYANPAIISFQNSQVALGVRGYHLGFFEESGMGYRQGFISALIPRVRGTRFGAGSHLQYFDSPIFRTSQFGVSSSYRILNGLSAGINASFHHMSFNRDNFVGFDFNDPVFQDGFSTYSFNAAFGLYYRPLDIVELAAGARNLTEPNLSLVSDNVTEPREYFTAVSLRHQFLKGTLELIHGRFGLQTRTHAEIYSSRGYYVRTGTNLNFDSGYLEAQAHIANGFSANYQFELPLNELAGNSSGSHMISLVYEFNKMPGLPSRRSAPVNIPGMDRPRLSPVPAPNILLSSQTDHVINYQKEIIRRVDENSISMDELQYLSEYDLGNIGDDPTIAAIPYSEKTLLPTVPIPETVEMSSSISPQYREAINYVLSQLERDDMGALKIKSNPGTELRAAGLRNLLRNQSGESLTVERISITSDADSARFDTPADISMIRDEKISEMDPQVARIQTVSAQPVNIRNWELLISDKDDIVIHRIEGGSTVPEVIEWDWRLNDGEFVAPGVYTYELNWNSTDGSSYQSNRRSLYVQKVLRKITIDITKDLNNILENPDKIDIILKNN